MPAAHVIYAKALAVLKHGYPLWEPDCKVSIGDVGYINDGYFCRLFNASLPPGHPLNHEFGVPEGYEQLTLDEKAMMTRTLPPGPMYSRSITNHGANIGISGSTMPSGLGVQFSCQKNGGAVLVINSEAHRKDSLQHDAFKKYMRKHLTSWLKFANTRPNSRGISQKDLIFVTGHDKTAEWAVAAFSRRSTSGGVQAQASVPNAGGVNFSTWGSWTGSTSPHLNSGPREPRKSTELVTLSESGKVGRMNPVAGFGDYDQCIFLRGFWMKVRFLNTMWPSSLIGLGRVYQSLPTEPSSEDESDRDEKPASMELLDYILQQKPEASVAIVHDDDLAAIIDDENDTIDFDLVLSEASPPIVVDLEGVGTISFNGSAATGVDHLTRLG